MAMEPGNYIVGELVGPPVEGRSYTRKDGTIATPGVIDLLIGRSVERIEYPDLAAAQAAVGDGAKPRDPIKIYKTQDEYKRAQRDRIRKSGETPIKAFYDEGGNCKICGECGRCPGWHTPEESSRAFKIAYLDE